RLLARLASRAVSDRRLQPPVDEALRLPSRGAQGRQDVRSASLRSSRARAGAGRRFLPDARDARQREGGAMKRRRVTRPTAAEREVLDLVLGEMRLARRKHEQLELLIDAWLT